MRAPTARTAWSSPSAFLVALALGSALGLTGCAQRFKLTPEELAKVQTEAGVNPLRVYPSKKMIVIYEPGQISEDYQVQRSIRESARGEVLEKLVPKNTAGLILKIEELNGKPLLWVTFESDCREVKCSYGFVETEDRHYRLVDLPEFDGFKNPKVYRGWKKRPLKKGKLASLAEANEVYLFKKNNGKLLTLDLDVKKIIDRRTKTERSRARGID